MGRRAHRGHGGLPALKKDEVRVADAAGGVPRTLLLTSNGDVVRARRRLGPASLALGGASVPPSVPPDDEPLVESEQAEPGGGEEDKRTMTKSSVHQRSLLAFAVPRNGQKYFDRKKCSAINSPACGRMSTSSKRRTSSHPTHDWLRGVLERCGPQLFDGLGGFATIYRRAAPTPAEMVSPYVILGADLRITTALRAAFVMTDDATRRRAFTIGRPIATLTGSHDQPPSENPSTPSSHATWALATSLPSTHITQMAPAVSLGAPAQKQTCWSPLRAGRASLHMSRRACGSSTRFEGTSARPPRRSFAPDGGSWTLARRASPGVPSLRSSRNRSRARRKQENRPIRSPCGSRSSTGDGRSSTPLRPTVVVPSSPCRTLLRHRPSTPSRRKNAWWLRTWHAVIRNSSSPIRSESLWAR